MSNVLKEGFLVKKGHFRQNWRTRWFVLREETLGYFRKREDVNPAGVIRLKGCSLVCMPPGEDSKHPWTIRLTTAEASLYLIQAPDLQARDAWAHSIAQCIRNLDSSTSVAQSEVERVRAASSTFCHYENSDIVQAMQDPSGGVPLEVCDRPTRGTPHYFTGHASLVGWLVKWSFARSGEDAKVLGRALLLEGHIKMVNMHTLERSGSFSCHNTDRGDIVDSHSQFYIFALFAPPKPLELFQEASDSDSDETEQPPCLMVQESRGDNVVKQGFLLRKSEGRREWKPRRFVLSKDSDQLVFYRGSKGKYPLGSIPLRGSSIVVGAGHSHSSQSDSEEERGEVTLTVITDRGLMYHLQAASAEELHAWRGVLSETIQTLNTKQKQ